MVAQFVQIEAADRQLLESISADMAEAARLSGSWLACRPGCTECCIGPFAITQLDALRLREGLRALQALDPARAAAVRTRASSYVSATAAIYPGDPVTGALSDEDSLPDAMDELPCPALDPVTGWCDLYSSRPITCRTFGPAVRAGAGTLAACELCYSGATEQEMIRCAVETDRERLESRILADLESHGIAGETIVAYALALPA